VGWKKREMVNACVGVREEVFLVRESERESESAIGIVCLGKKWERDGIEGTTYLPGKIRQRDTNL